MKKVGIALGGGGAKFFAHLGALDVFKENRIPFNYFSCASMGSIAGALVANEVETKDIKREFFRARDKLLWFRPSFRRFGLFAPDRIYRAMDNLLPQHRIEKSAIPFTITSVDLLSGKMHLFKDGDISTAVAASCAFPGIFPPVETEGKMLVDGGVINNIPADLCRKAVGKNGVVIASSLDTTLTCKKNQIKNPFDVYQRVIYIPMYEKRLDIIKKNADFHLQPFGHKIMSIRTGQDILKINNKKIAMEFYKLGQKEAEAVVDQVSKKVGKTKSI